MLGVSPSSSTGRFSRAPEHSTTVDNMQVPPEKGPDGSTTVKIERNPRTFG